MVASGCESHNMVYLKSQLKCFNSNFQYSETNRPQTEYNCKVKIITCGNSKDYYLYLWLLVVVVFYRETPSLGFKSSPEFVVEPSL